MKAKYVMYKSNNDFVIFPQSISHNIMGNKDTCISAGFINFFINKKNIDVKCYGESVSIGLKSRLDEDSKIIKSKLLD